MGIIEQLDEISKELKELKEETKPKKEKKYRLPFGKKVSNKQKRDNYVTVVKINENGQASFTKEKIAEQTIMLDGIPRIVTPDYIVNYKKNPMIFIPSYSVLPLNLREQHAISLKDGSNIAGYQLLLNKLKLSGVDQKKKMPSIVGWILGAGLIGIIVYAFISGGI